MLCKVQSVDQRMRIGMRCRLSPTADVPSHTSGAAMRCHHRAFARSLNYLIGTRDERRRYGKPQLLGCLEVDGQLEFGYLVDRDVAGLCPSENCVDVNGGVLMHLDQIEGIGHQAAGFYGFNVS